MKFIYTVLFVLILQLTAIDWAFGQQIQCHDTLSGSLWGDQIKKANLNCIRGFEYAFGKSFQPVAKEFLQSGKIYLGVDCLWSDTHTFGDKDIKLLKECASNYQKLAEQYSHAKIELTPFTEHNLSNPDKYNDIAQAACPKCTIVNSVYKGAFSNKYKNEVHGSHKAPNGRYNYSYDGTDCTNSNVTADLQKHARAERFYLWAPRYNLRYREKDTTPRPQRIKEYKDRSPTVDYIQGINYLFSNKGTYNLPKNWLNKSFAENHGDLGKPDLKGDKLLIISPIKANEITLKRGGKEIGKLRYYGGFDGGGFRYYAQQMAYKFGSEVDIFIGKKKYGTINPGFRSAPFR